MLNKDKAFVTGDNIIDLVEALNAKNAVQAMYLYSDINTNTANITAEKNRATTKEDELLEAIKNEASTRAADDENIQNTLQEDIDNERQSREIAISAVEADYNKKIYTLETNIIDINDGAIAKAIRTLEIDLRADIANKEADIRADLNSEIKNREELNDEVDRFTDNVNEQITKLNTQVSDNNNSINTLSSHTTDYENPHKVSAAQIGAATIEDLQNASESIEENKSAITSIESSITDIKSESLALTKKVTTLEDNKLNNSGQETLTGKLTIAKNNDGSFEDGDLVVQGDLRVYGTTITENHETINVENNFIIVNSDGQTLESSLAGIAIRTDATTAYGIAYDPTNHSVSLGYGVVNDDQFSFNIGENNPILTRAESDDLENQDKHFLIWDQTTKKAITTPYSSEDFPAKSDYDNLKAKVDYLDIDLNNTKDDITKLSDHAIAQEKFFANAIEELTDNKQSILDYSLDTDAKTIPAAINEVLLHTNDNLASLDSHTQDFNNPHKITWKQIYTQGDVLSDVIPYMSQEGGYEGVSARVSRADHAHPTDTSRAPMNHASTSTLYGKATDTNYGHVQVDTAINPASENPVQNKVIKQYVDQEIKETLESLSPGATSLNSNETLSSIAQINGQLYKSVQPIKISQDQVIELVNDLSSIRQDIKDTNELISGTKEELNTTIDETIVDIDGKIDSLKTYTDNQDINLQNNINAANEAISYINKEIGFVELLNNNIEETLTAYGEEEFTKRNWVLSFSLSTATGITPHLTTMDDGVLN